LGAEKKKPSSLATRFAVGIPFGTLCVGLLVFGDFSLLILVMAITMFSLREWWRLTGLESTWKPISRFRLIDIGCLFILWYTWAVPDSDKLHIVGIVLVIIFIVNLLDKNASKKTILEDMGKMTLGVVYIAGFLSFIMQLRALEDIYWAEGLLSVKQSAQWTANMHYLPMFAFLASLGYDTSAYFSGKFFGRHQLAPNISPRKSVMGLIGGMFGAAFCVWMYSNMIGMDSIIPVWELILFGAIGGAVSQVGDLTMSAVKREAHLKDSGHILLAHGGMLDRIDGFLFTVPVTYLFFLIAL
jgi:phosphatidate cytidylyltransferase